MPLPLIGISMGDPAGIGPEICLRAATSPAILELCRPLIFGDCGVLGNVIDACGPPIALASLPASNSFAAVKEVQPTSQRVFVAPCVSSEADVTEPICPGQISATTGNMSYISVCAAVDAAAAGHIAALVTAPIHKEAWHAAGIQYPGHTELLAERTNTQNYCMMMTATQLSCSLVTCHVGLAAAVRQLNRSRIEQVVGLTHEAMFARLGRPPRLLVLGLNPHAGEGGLFGNGEEEKEIAPAVIATRREGILVDGPVPPDTAFVPSRLSQYDAHICMYHDQGLIPFKALAFDTGVNVTLGLPIVRTSVDHGTALDLAWQGKAEISSMIAAIKLAVQLSS